MARTVPRASSPSRIVRTCENCGTVFEPKRSDQLRCTIECHREQMNREATRGRLVYRILYHWFLRPSPGLLAKIRDAVKGWAAEDKRDGRPPPT